MFGSTFRSGRRLILPVEYQAKRNGRTKVKALARRVSLALIAAEFAPHPLDSVRAQTVVY
jgi:hypothetical protein